MLTEKILVHPAWISDHKLLQFQQVAPKPFTQLKAVTVHNWKAVDTNDFLEDLKNQNICNISLAASESSILYNNILCDLADKHEPPRVKKIYHHPHAPWFTEELRTNKTKKRQLERRYQRANLPEDFQSLTAHYQQYCDLLVSTRNSFYMDTVLGSSGDQRVLFPVLNKLLH